MKRFLLTGLFILTAVSPVMSKTQYHHPRFNFGLTGDLPLMITNGPSFSFFAEVRFKIGLGIMADFNFSKSYFYYKEGSWRGPANWGEVDHLGTSMLDWSFYQWNCQAAILLVWYLPLKYERFTLFIAGGPQFYWLMPSGSAVNYPEFDTYFNMKRSSLSYTPGLQFRLGCEFIIIEDFLFIQTGLKFKMNDLAQLGNTVQVNGFGNYFVNNTEIYVGLSVGF